MVKNVSRAQWAGRWLAAIVVMFASSIVLGGSTTGNATALWLFACLAPPTVMMLVWRGAPPLTVAEVLYQVNNTSKDGRT
jgi:hypothetical protein